MIRLDIRLYSPDTLDEFREDILNISLTLITKLLYVILEWKQQVFCDSIIVLDRNSKGLRSRLHVTSAYMF